MYRQNETKTSVVIAVRRLILRKKTLLASLFVLGGFCLYKSPSSAVPEAASQIGTFRFHIHSEPHSMDPASLVSIDATYFYHNVMRGLYTFSNTSGLSPEGAEKCLFENSRKLICTLSKNAYWSDGKRVEAKDYVRSFQHLMAPASKNPAVELLLKLKNARSVLRGEKPVSELGIKALDERTLIFEFSEPDPDFLYKLTASILVPIRSANFPQREKSEDLVFNGPYRIRNWIPNRRIQLEPNPYYRKDSDVTPNKRPLVEVLFIDDDQTALTLYEKGILTFLRRLPTHHIPKYKGRKDFHQFPVARFDYVGFGEDLKKYPDLRAALSFAADYRELQKIYDALGIPGCPSLPEEFMDRPRCLSFDLKKAKAHWAKVPEAVKKKRFTFMFSKLGGDDLKKGAEWFQAQWLKNLGLRVDLAQTESGVMLHALHSRPPAIFRKGVGLERPTCLAALETFSKDGAENFLGMSDPAYEKLLGELETSMSQGPGSNARKTKSICGAAIQHLLDQHLLIPLGRIHFTLLVMPRFQGWSLNEMNQLDLSRLKYIGDHAKP